MALINKVDNSASITYAGNTIESNSVSTLLLLAPTIVKAVDKATANINDTLTYTVTITNVSLSAINNIAFLDTIAQGVTFQSGSFTVNGSAATPTLTASTLAYTIPAIAAVSSAILQFKVTVVGGSST